MLLFKKNENNNLMYLFYTYPLLIIYTWKWDKKDELNSLMKLLKKKTSYQR